jgi:hypothetical protein
MHLRFLETVPMSTDNIRTLLGYGEEWSGRSAGGHVIQHGWFLPYAVLCTHLGESFSFETSPITAVGTLPGLLVLLSPAEKSGGKGERVKVRGLLALEGAGGLHITGRIGR